MAITLNPIPGIAAGAADFGTPDSSAQNPLLVPDFYQPVALNGQIIKESPNTYLGQSAYQRTAATDTVTVAGTVTAGDQFTIKLAHGVFTNYGGTQAVTITTTATPTDGTVASQLVAAVANNAVLASFGVTATNVA